MEDNERIKIIEKCLSRLLSWISSAETKIATFFAIDTAMLGVLAALASRCEKWKTLNSCSTISAGILLLFSLLFLAIATFPRLKGPKNSILYFGGIAKKCIEQYKTEACDLENNQYLDDLIFQCHRNAEIAMKKFIWIRRSAIALFITIIPWLIAIFSLYKSTLEGAQK